MKKIVQRYIGAHFVGPFVMSGIFFMSFLLTFQMFRIMKLVVNKDIDLVIILSLIGDMSLTFVPMAIPIASLFAGMYTMSKLSNDSEIMAMRSFGLSRLDILLPICSLAFIVSLLVFSLHFSIIPQSKKNFRDSLSYLSSKGLLSDIKKGEFYTEIPGLTLFAKDVDETGEHLYDVFIHSRPKKERAVEEKIIMAQEGRWVRKRGPNPNGQVRFHLKNGNILKKYSNKNEMEKVVFQEYEFPVASGNISSNSDVRGAFMTTRRLYRRLYKDHPAGMEKDRNFRKDELELWSRFNTPVITFLFALLGAAIGVQNGRGRNRGPTGISILILTSYYAVFFLLLALAKSGVLLPVVAIFLPAALLVAVISVAINRLEWVG